MLAIHVYLLFASGNDVADRMTGLENSERRRPEGKDSSEDDPEPFITCKEWKKLIKNVFKELKKDKLLNGSKIKSMEVCEQEGKYTEDGPLHEHAEASCLELDDPYFTVCEREFPDLMAKWCREEVGWGDGAFDEKDAEDFIGCGDGEDYSLYGFGQVPVALGKEARLFARSIPKKIRTSDSVVLEREARLLRAGRSIPKTIRSSNGQPDALMLLYFQHCYGNPSTPQCDSLQEMLSRLHAPSESRLERAKRTTLEERRNWSPTDDLERRPSQPPSQKEVLSVCQENGRNSVECQMLLAEVLSKEQLYNLKFLAGTESRKQARGLGGWILGGLALTSDLDG